MVVFRVTYVSVLIDVPGYMGTEENIISLLYYRFPQLVHDFDNGPGGNCAIFSHIAQQQV